MMMTICLISQEYPPETNWGGIATYTQVLARQLVKIGQRVHVITLAESAEYTTDDLGVTVHRVSRTPQEPFDPGTQDDLDGLNHGLLYFSQRVYEKVIEIHNQNPIDVIEAPETCAQALLTFKHLNGVIKITRLHTPFFWVRKLNNMTETAEHLVRDQLEKLQTELSTAVTSPTRAMADVVTAQWRTENIAVIPNFFNLKEYTPDLSVYQQLLNSKEYILFFGRLEYRKGVHVLAQALPEVLEQHPGITAVLVGSDSTYNSMSMKSYLLEQLNGYEDRVCFIENIPHAALYPLIEKAKFVILPSLWENFPYVCIEAMALEKTVVASNAGGFPEIIENGTEGVLTAPGDVAALRQAIFDCLDKLDLPTLGEKARQKAATYDTDKIVRKMLEFYSSHNLGKIQKSPQVKTVHKVAYVLRHIPVPSETFVINEILALQSLGVEVHPVSLLPAQQCHKELMSRLDKEVLDLSRPEAKAGASSSPFFEASGAIASRYGVSPELAAQAALVADFVSNEGLTYIHAHFATESAFVAMIAAKLTGVPCSFTSHAYDIFRTSNTGTLKEDSPEKRLATLLPETDLACTISDFNKQCILEKTDRSYSEKIRLVRCGIDPAKFEFIARKPCSEITVLCVGRFVEKKGYEYLLRSFRNLLDVVPTARLRLIGEGNLQEPMRLLAGQLEIAHRTEFLGATSSEAVLEEMGKADIFALHSITASDGDMEGIPVSLMEASATGLPVVTTMHSGIPELVLDGTTGFLAKEKDVDEFSNYLIALASSPELRNRMGAAGRKQVTENFNLHIEAAKLAGYFSEVASKERRATSADSYSDSVDIIMPTYNCDVHLMRRAIKSVLGQEFKNWNLFVVKDGGDSDVASLMKEFDDRRIHYEEVPHAGKPVALNHALSLGRGKYIAYLDDDDIWYPSHLQTCIGYMEQNKVKFVHTDAYEIVILKEGQTLTEKSRKLLGLGILTEKTLVSISHINAVHERELVDEAGPYDVGRRFFIDWDMFLRMASFSFPAHIKTVTCEHYIYVDQENKQKNTITGIHKNDPELSWRMQTEMYQRALSILSPEAYVEFVSDWLNKAWQVDDKEKRIAALEKELAEHAHLVDLKAEEFRNSLSWKITKPLRYIYDLLFNSK